MSLSTPRRTYVVHAITGAVLFYAGGENPTGIQRALDYVIRRHALINYLAMRRGNPPNAYEPTRIMARTGRVLMPGQSIMPAHGKWRTATGYAKGAEGPALEDVVSVLPAARRAGRLALERQYPKTWNRYQWFALPN